MATGRIGQTGAIVLLAVVEGTSIGTGNVARCFTVDLTALGTENKVEYAMFIIVLVRYQKLVN